MTRLKVLTEKSLTENLTPTEASELATLRRHHPEAESELQGWERFGEALTASSAQPTFDTEALHRRILAARRVAERRSPRVAWPHWLTLGQLWQFFAQPRTLAVLASTLLILGNVYLGSLLITGEESVDSPVASQPVPRSAAGVHEAVSVEGPPVDVRVDDHDLDDAAPDSNLSDDDAAPFPIEL